MLESLTAYPLIFGFLAAMIHVVSGPDHLAAVAPIAVSTRFKHWMIGMSWGIGHLLGMLLIGVLFLFFRELIPIDLISTHSERIVGLLLIGIGFWSIFRIYQHHKKSGHRARAYA